MIWGQVYLYPQLRWLYLYCLTEFCLFMQQYNISLFHVWSWHIMFCFRQCLSAHYSDQLFLLMHMFLYSAAPVPVYSLRWDPDAWMLSLCIKDMDPNFVRYWLYMGLVIGMMVYVMGWFMLWVIHKLSHKIWVYQKKYNLICISCHCEQNVAASRIYCIPYIFILIMYKSCLS